jgi:hypothetical protein
MNLGAITDEIHDLQARVAKAKTAFEAKIKPDIDRIEELTEQLKLSMQDQGLSEVKGRKGIAKYAEKLRIGIADFGALDEFVRKAKALHLFERRISVAAYRELLEQRKGKPIPGLSEYMQPNCTVTKSKANAR